MTILAIVGTRLDRPSVVGTDGRPRAASLTAATLLLAGFVLGVGRLTGAGAVLETVALGSVLLGVGVALLDREAPPHVAMGYLCFFLGGLVGLYGLLAALLLLGPARLGVLVGIALALFGGVGAWADALGDARLQSVTRKAWVVVVLLLAASVPLGMAVGTAWIGGPLVRQAILGPAGSVPALASLLLLTCAAALSAMGALRRLPLEPLADPAHRGRVAAARERAFRLAAAIAVVGFVGGIGVGIWRVSGQAAAFYRSLPLGVVAGLASVVNSPLLRVPLALAGTLLLVATAIAALARWLTGDLRGFASRHSPAIGAAVVLVIPTPVVGVLLYVGTRSGSAVGLFLAIELILLAYSLLLLVYIVFMLGFSVLAVGTALDVIPDRSGGLAMASGGLFLSTLALGVAGAPSWAVFAGVGTALLVWDLSTYGLGISRELGRLPETRRLELLHGVVGLGVVLGGGAIAVAIHRFAVGPGGSTPAVAVIGAGVTVVVLVLRG